MKPTHLIWLFSFLTFGGLAQDNGTSSWQKMGDKLGIKTSLGLQLWGSYTIGQSVFDPNLQQYLPVDDRLNFQIRRTRLDLNGQPYENLQFKLTAALDLVGRDLLAGTEAGANNGASPIFRLWNAYLQWRIRPGSEKIIIVAGYLPPQIGRESITGAMASTSMEKSWSQNYLRRHITGIAPGRSAGINIGGLFLQADRSMKWSYDVGIFTPVYEGYGGNSVGRQFAPLFTGRGVLYLGDPESNKYTIGHKVNYFGKRKGLSLALAGAAQGKTDLFSSNAAAGMDFLLNWGALNFDGEWTYLWREGSRPLEDLERSFSVGAETGYLRLSYNIPLHKGFMLEPVLMVVRYEGEVEAAGQADASAVNMPAGTEQIVDAGLNFYFNPDLRLSLHYTWREGDPGAAGPGATVNNYFFQAGVGAIHRGDWLGLGLLGVF